MLHIVENQTFRMVTGTALLAMRVAIRRARWIMRLAFPPSSCTDVSQPCERSSNHTLQSRSLEPIACELGVQQPCHIAGMIVVQWDSCCTSAEARWLWDSAVVCVLCPGQYHAC